MFITKFFRIATEGTTADNREIKRSWLIQAAKNYDPKIYSSGIWMEHIRGFSSNSEFGRLGDIVELQTREDSDGKLALYARISPRNELIELNKQGKKLFGSIEISEDFAKTGEAYLVGLGVTDSPSSLSVERLQLFSERKEHPDNIYSEAIDFSFELEEVNETGQESLGDKIKSLFSKLRGEKNAQKQEFTEAIEPVVQGIVDLEEKVNQINQYSSNISDFKKEIENFSIELENLKKDVSEYAAQPAPTELRPIVTGGTNQNLTNC